MLVSKTAMVRWNGYTRKWYEEKGYNWTKQNEFFECKVEDLMPTTTARVEVKCDYCNNGKAMKEYRSYLNERELIDKDCCKNRSCMVKKSEEISILKYGVSSFSKTQESKEYHRKLYQTPMETILKISNEKGLEILNIEDYENDRTRLFVICKYHKEKGILETNFANIKKSKYCCMHGGAENTGKSKRLNGKIVLREFVDSGLIPLFKPEDYISNNTPLPYKCPQHLEQGIQYREYANLKNCTGCRYCSFERISNSLRSSEDEVFSYFNKRGLILLENQTYKNKETHLYFRCPNHLEYIQKISLSNLQNTKMPCEYCRIEQSLTSLNKRLRSSLNQWKKESEKLCNFKCVLTGSNMYDIHHTYSYNNIIKDALIELGLEVKNTYSSNEYKIIKNKVIELHNKYPGICIRNDLHILFHQMYDKHNNTMKQFEEFKTKYFNNELYIEREEGSQ